MNRYSEVLLTAGSLREAEDLAADAVLPEIDIEQFEEPVIVSADRMGPKEFAKEVGRVLGKSRSANQSELGVSKIWTRRWLTSESD